MKKLMWMLQALFFATSAYAGEYVYLPDHRDDNEMFGLSNVFPNEDYSVKVYPEVKQISNHTTTKAPVYEPSHPFKPWTFDGFYAGGLIGGMWFNNTNLWSTTDTLAQTTINSGFINNGQDIKASGVIGGAVAGFNKQINYWVFSGEIEFSGTGIKKEIDTNNPGSACLLNGNLLGSFFVTLATSQCGGSTQTTINEKMDWYFANRGRIGYAFGSFMPYVAGGLSVAEMKLSANVASQGNVPGFTGLSAANSISKLDVGWNLGGGVEYAFGQVVVRWEAFYFELANIDIAAFPYNINSGRITGAATRLGVTYLFN